MLEQFLDQHTKHPAGLTRLSALHHAFLASLPPEDRPAWTRTRFAAELARLGYRVGTYERTAHAFGILIGQPIAG